MGQYANKAHSPLPILTSFWKLIASGDWFGAYESLQSTCSARHCLLLLLINDYLLSFFLFPFCSSSKPHLSFSSRIQMLVRMPYSVPSYYLFSAKDDCYEFVNKDFVCSFASNLKSSEYLTSTCGFRFTFIYV